MMYAFCVASGPLPGTCGFYSLPHSTVVARGRTEGATGMDESAGKFHSVERESEKPGWEFRFC